MSKYFEGLTPLKTGKNNGKQTEKKKREYVLDNMARQGAEVDRRTYDENQVMQDRYNNALLEIAKKGYEKNPNTSNVWRSASKAYENETDSELKSVAKNILLGVKSISPNKTNRDKARQELEKYNDTQEHNKKMSSIANQLINNPDKAKREIILNEQEDKLNQLKKENRTYFPERVFSKITKDKFLPGHIDTIRDELAEQKLKVKEYKQQDYTATQQENAAKLESNKKLAKMIDLGAQVKLNKGIMTVDAENAQAADGQSPMAKRTLDYAQWKTYKKQLGKMGYSDEDIDDLVETRINQINGEVYEGNQALGEHAPALAEAMKLAQTPQSEISNFGNVLKKMATGKVQASPVHYLNAGLKSGIGNYAENSGIDFSGLLNTENNNIFKVNDKNELIFLGENQGNVNRIIYNQFDNDATNVLNSLVFGGGLTGGMFARSVSEKAMQALITTSWASGLMGEELAEQLYNGEETSQAYKKAVQSAATNWLSEMIGSPIEWSGIKANSWLGNALIIGTSEALEEPMGNWFDRIWDYVENGRASEISQKYKEYIDKGLSPVKAKFRIFKDIFAEDAFAFANAFVSGTAMGGASAISDSIQENTANKIIGSEIYKNRNETTLIEEAKKIDSEDIQKLVKKAEKAKTNGAKQKTRGELLNAIQEHNIKANNKEAYDTVYKTIAKHSNSKKVATEVANAVVNGKKAKSTVAKQYVQDIESNNSRLAKRINDRLETIDYGTNVRQAYANTMTSEKSKSFEEYTQGLPTPQQLYNDVSAIRTSEFAKQDEEKQKVKSELENRLQNRAETLTRENSQEEIAKENKQALDDSTKEILNKGETADYSDVSGIASVDNGVVLLNTKDGDTVALGNVDFGNNEEDKTLFNLSSAFGNAANTFIANYKVNHQGENINTYFDRAQLAYNSGLNGVEYNKVFGESTYGMSETEARAFYDEGAKQAKAVAKNKAFKEKVKKMGKGVHIMDDVNLTEEQSKEVEVLSKIVEGTSAKIVIAKSSNSAGVAKSNGYYDQNAIVIFAKEAGNAITSYAGHELTHYLKENVSKELYDDYHNFVIEQLKSKGENIYNDLVNAYANAYDYDPQTQMQSIEEEMAADNGLAVFSDEKALTTLAKDNRTLLEKIHDFFKQFIDKLKDIKLKLSKSSAVYATINHDIDYLEQSAQKIRTMLDNVKSKEIVQDVNTKYSKNTSGYIKNGSQCDRVVESLDKYLSKKYDDTFELDGNKVEFISIEQSHGMGSYATFYIDFSINDTDGITIRYSGHTNSSADYYLWNDDFSSMKEIKEAIDDIIEQEVKIEKPKRQRLIEETTAKLNKSNISYSKNTLDSEGNELTEQQQEYFKDSKVRDDDGNLQVVYHGTTEDFTVFDKTKGRANMDIQGMFFSPWELDAQGYGSNVKAYYLNITNPAPEQVGYKALKMFQGQNNAGVKAREYLESLGYDGVNNNNEEFIAFNSNQIKLTDNLNPTDNLDIRYSKNTEFGEEIEKWDKDGRANGKTFIIGDTSDVLQGLGAIDNQIYFYSDKINNILKKHNDTMSLDIIKRVPDIIDNPALIMSSHSRSQENNTRLLMFGNVKNQDGKPIMCVLDLQPYENGMIISDMQKLTSAYPLTNEQININDYLSKSDVLYITKNKKIATKLVRQIGFHQNGVPIAFQQSGYIGNITYNNRSVNIKGKPFFDVVNVDSDKQSRNTRLTLDDNIEDVNEAFLSAVNVLQNVHIDDIDLSSEVVTKAENAAKHIQNEVKKSGYRTQKRTGKGSVRSIATELSEKYGNGKVTKSLVTELAELYDYIANSEVTDMSYVNSQAKIIANELINAKDETLVSATDKAPTELLEELKRPIRIDENTKNQLAYDYGNWENAKRYISQFLTIDQKANDSALTLYEDLMSEYSDYINNEGDSVMNGKSAVDKLVDFAERTQDVVVNSYDNELAQTGFISEYDENGNLIGQYNSIDEFETAVASDIFDNFFDVEQVKNAIDKLKTEQKDKIRALREQTKEEKAVIRQTYKELYNQKLANEKQKYAESKELYNQKLANEKQKLANYKQYKKEVAERGRERKQTNLYKKRILRLKVQIERQLLNPKGANYVPRELVRSMADVCNIITGANVFNKNGTPRSGYEALLSLQDRYQKLKNDPDYDYSSEYNEDMEQRLSDLKDSLKGKQLSNLSNSEMQNVYEIVKGISTSLSQAKKLINSSIKISAHQSAVELIKQQYATKGKGHTPFGKIDYETLNVMRYVNLISEGNKDGILNKLFDDLNRGERKKDYLIMKWQKPFDELVKDNKNYKKFRERVVETPFIDVYGNKAKLTEAQIVQLIASAKREQGRNHLSGGGFVALDTKKAFKKGATEAKIDGTKVENIADNLIPIIAELSNKLSPYAQKWLNLSENLFNEETKSEINETSFTLKGFKIANEKYYVPILVDKDFTNAQLEGIMRDKSLENAGFTKETNKFAKNRIIIEGIDQIVERHINNVASYVSLTVPIRNFNKVWNGQTSQYYDGFVIDDLNKKYYGNKNSFSVKETIKEKWGENAQKLIEQAIQDLQTTRESNISQIQNKILNAEITATFMGNISIVLKQAASYPTAVAVLSSTSLAKGSKGFAYFTGTKKLQSLFDEIDEHTGAHYKRRIGMQTEELAALSSSQSGFMGKWANSKFGALHPAKWIQAMDVQTTAALWLATKYEVDKMSRYKKGSAEYWQAVTDLYDKVIEETQPEYDVLHRAEIQKESNFLAKTLSLFQTQPLQNSGILYNSYREVMWAKRNYKADSSEANKKALQVARKNAVKANWAIASAGITFSVFSFLATMLVLHKTKKYKDEDGKVTAKSVMKGIGKESVETILTGFVPIAGSYVIDLVSRILTAIKTGTLSDYDYIENMGLSAINDFLSSIAQLSIDGFNAISCKGTLDDLKKSSKNFAKQAAQIMGIPANNIDNFIKSGTAYYHELIKKDYALWEYSSQTPTSKEQIEKYVAYVNEGDKSNAEERMNKWLELNQDKDKSDFESRVATYLASSDSDIVRAIQNRYSYNTAEYEKILNEVVNRGYSKQTVISAAQSVFNKVENTAKAKFYGNTDDYEEAFNELVALGYDEKTLQKHIDGLQSDFSNDETENKVKGKYTVDELYKVWSEQGENSEAYKSMYDDILQTKIANGSDEEKAQESIKNSIKKKYKDNSPELQAAQNAYESGDMATYQRNINKVISQGKLDKETIVSAARGTKSYKNTLWTATDYAKAIESGNKNQALSIYRDLCKANGNEKDERQYIRSSTTTYYRKKWLDTKTDQERKDILKHLRNAGFYTNSDIESLMTKWEKARKEKEKE